MKVLLTIGITQLLVLAFIAYKSVSPELQTAPERPLAESGGPDPGPKFSFNFDGGTAAPQNNWELTLREIMREEIASAILALSENPVEREPHRMPVRETGEIRDRVFTRLDYYESVGSISDLQLSELEADIVRLDDHGRREALVRLAKALNANPSLLAE